MALTNAPTLFDMSPTADVPPCEALAVPRQKQIKRAFAKADKWVIAKYEAVLDEFRGRVFGPWEVTALYESRHGKLSLAHKRALGWVFQARRHSGQIVVAGIGKRPNGNDTVTYRFS